MNRFLFFLFVSLCLFLETCKKESSAFYLNATFQTENTTSVNPVRLFTRNGEITDTQFIRNFIDRNTTGNGLPDNFLFNIQTQPLNPSLSLKVSFGNNNTATVERYHLIVPGQLETHEAEFRNISSSELLITETDSVTGSSYSIEYCQDLTNTLLTFIPNTNCIHQSGNIQICKWKNSFPIEINGTQLMLPMILTMTVHGWTPSNGYGCDFAHTIDTWNTFNSNIINSFQPTDTIAIQTKGVLLQKL